MNWGVVWYTDFADWSVISLCTKAIQACVIFLVGNRSFTQYVLVQFYGISEFCKNSGFSLSGSHMVNLPKNNNYKLAKIARYVLAH